MTTEAVSPAAAAMRVPRWLLVTLFVSLALNLLIIGLIGGMAWRFRHVGPPHAWGPPNLIGYAMSLDGDRHKALRDLTTPTRNAMKPLRRDILAARTEVTNAVVAEPFDQARFDVAQGRLVELENKAREQALSLSTEIARSLTPDERRAYKAWRENRRPRGPGFFDDGDGPPGQGPPVR